MPPTQHAEVCWVAGVVSRGPPSPAQIAESVGTPVYHNKA
jgi:hypothetical protein